MDNLFLLPICQILNRLSISYSADYLVKVNNAAGEWCLSPGRQSPKGCRIGGDVNYKLKIWYPALTNFKLLNHDQGNSIYRVIQKDGLNFISLYFKIRNWWFQRQMLFLVGGSMLKRRRNARCTAVADSVLMNSRTQKILCCIVAILLSTDAAARQCARRAHQRWYLKI